MTATAGVALLVLAVVRAGDTLQATQPVLLGAAAIVLLTAFVVRERRAPAPLLDLALLKDRGIAGANLTLIAVGAFSAAQVLLTTLYLQEGRGLSPVLTGLCFIPQAAGAFALAGPAGRLVPALGPRRALAIALSIALLALAGAAAAVLAARWPGCWRPSSRSASPPGSARSPPPWPAPAGRSPPGPRGRPARCSPPPGSAARRSASPSCPRHWSPSTAASVTGRRWRCW